MASEPVRGCGYRKIGGLYLVGAAPLADCHRLPFLLHICPTCGHGIKQSRGWTWVDAPTLLGGSCGQSACRLCPTCRPEMVGRAGLLWVGECYYPRPQDFLREAREERA